MNSEETKLAAENLPMPTLMVNGKAMTAADIAVAMTKSAAIASAAQDLLTYLSSMNGIPPAMGKFDPRNCSDGGRLIESYWRLFDLLHPDTRDVPVD